MSSAPSVTVIIPVRNEGNFILKCLDSLGSQTISKELLEVLVIDGASTDKTREIVRSYSQKRAWIKLLENAEINTAAGLNTGIRAAMGDIVVRVDGHSWLENDYIEKCVELLSRTGADNVGGPMRPVGDSYIGRAIALATCSIF